jgi:hypothetical protein
MPDGKPYRGLRGGNWYNGQNMYGHGRVANRDPSYYRGPGDPNGPWFHIGFRVIRTDTSCEAGYRILRHEVSNLSDPLSLHLPLDPTRDLFQTTAANPFVVTGDVTPTAAPLIFYEVVAAPLVRLGKEGTDVALNF